MESNGKTPESDFSDNVDDQPTFVGSREEFDPQETLVEKAVEDVEVTLVTNQEFDPEATLPEEEGSENSGVTSRLVPGDMIGSYQVERELGRGGMGVVYKALDTKLGRNVALKLIINSTYTSDKEVERFFREAKATAQLNHENIVRLYEFGDQPCPYFSMEYIDGYPLSAWRGKHSYREIVAIMVKVTKAIEFAHQKDIIHRDLKPANIMIAGNEEPKVMDFGLAKSQSVTSSLSQPGDVVGTPAYMSPEQAMGDPVDVRTDIYALGATLYDLLTERPPFQGESYYNILHQIYHQDPISPRVLNPDLPSDLEAICLKCLEKDPLNRYPTTASLAKDLQNYLDNKPIWAKPPSRLTYTRKFLWRHRIIASAVFMVISSLLVGGIFSFLQWQKTTQLAQDANLQLAAISLAKATEAYHSSEWRNSGALATTAIRFIHDQDNLEADKIRKRASGLLEIALGQQRVIWEKKTFTKNILTTKNNHVFAMGTDGFEVRNWETGELLQKTGLPSKKKGKIRANSQFFITTKGKSFTWSSIENGEKKGEYSHSHMINQVQIHPEKDFVTFASYDGKVTLLSLEDEEVLWQHQLLREYQSGVKGKSNRITALSFSPNGQYIAVGGTGGRIFIIETETGEKEGYDSDCSYVRGFAFHRSEPWLAVQSSSSILLGEYCAKEKEPMDEFLISDEKVGEFYKILDLDDTGASHVTFSHRFPILHFVVNQREVESWIIHKSKQNGMMMQQMAYSNEPVEMSFDGPGGPKPSHRNRRTQRRNPFVVSSLPRLGEFDENIQGIYAVFPGLIVATEKKMCLLDTTFQQPQNKVKYDRRIQGVTAWKNNQPLVFSSGNAYQHPGKKQKDFSVDVDLLIDKENHFAVASYYEIEIYQRGVVEPVFKQDVEGTEAIDFIPGKVVAVANRRETNVYSLTNSKKTLATLPASNNLQLSNRETLFLSAANEIREWSWDNKQQNTWKLPKDVALFCLSPRSPVFIGFLESNQLFFLNYTTNEVSFYPYSGRVHKIVFSSDQRFVAFVENNQSIEVWDLENRVLWSRLTGEDEEITAAYFSQNNQELIVSIGRYIYQWQFLNPINSVTVDSLPTWTKEVKPDSQVSFVRRVDLVPMGYIHQFIQKDPSQFVLETLFERKVTKTLSVQYQSTNESSPLVRDYSGE